MTFKARDNVVFYKNAPNVSNNRSKYLGKILTIAHVYKAGEEQEKRFGCKYIIHVTPNQGFIFRDNEIRHLSKLEKVLL